MKPPTPEGTCPECRGRLEDGVCPFCERFEDVMDDDAPNEPVAFRRASELRERDAT